VYVPKAFASQAEFEAAVSRAARGLAPVVRVIPTLGNDWSGEPAVFFMVILSDAASSRRDQLLNIAEGVSKAIVGQLEPVEQWGVRPYFNFRSQSEQAKLEPTLA